jgi:hypothetical protein
LAGREAGDRHPGGVLLDADCSTGCVLRQAGGDREQLAGAEVDLGLLVGRWQVEAVRADPHLHVVDRIAGVVPLGVLDA